VDKGLAKAFGAILRARREATELSQEALAHKCELDRTYISMLERGIRQPTIETLFRLADAMEMRASEFIVALEKSIRRKSG
jgi:transcriptional regulator with XRE-family HTH domain